MVQSSAATSYVASAAQANRKFSLKTPAATSAFTSESEQITERLISASVQANLFWEQLIDELTSSASDAPLTPAICEVALLRAGHSQLQSDQTAAAVYRSLENCRRLLTTDLPRLPDQLRLRYAPLKQAYECYGPGMLRSIGNQIWNGSPPKHWWPGRVTVHAVQPLQTGAAGRSSHQASVWIEAVLTDISPDLPEWLRLVYQITQMAIDTHTRTHASGVSSSSAGTAPAAASATSSAATNKEKTPSDGRAGGELPWSLGIIPLILSRAADAGLLPADNLPVATALELGWTGNEFAEHAELANILTTWWREVGSDTKALPIALKQLSARLAETGAR
jgi:hypothetical protein